MKKFNLYFVYPIDYNEKNVVLVVEMLTSLDYK